MLMAMTEETMAGDNWEGKDEVLNDMWVDESRKKGKDEGVKSATAHLEGLKWEVAHAVARHAAEQIRKNLWFTIRQLIL
ncbi:hypothetical protein Hdeb2414_s0007g00238231 [Helianthus debilis subsp. tardiflorus]